MDDSRIVNLYLERCEDAIDLTAEKYGSRIRAFAFGIVKDEQTVEECENDTYLKAWNSIPPNEPRNYLYAFLLRIARNISLNYCRNRSRLKRSAHISELSSEMEQCIPSPDDTESYVDEQALRKAINDFICSLSKQKRIIFVRRYWYMDSIESISRHFGMTQSNAKTTLFRIRSQFRTYLEKEGFDI